MTKKTVFSGVQPTGGLQLGNYLGAFRNFAPLQQRYNCIYCVVDLHAITVWHDPQQLRDNVREVAAAFVATGIDTDEHILFVQSQVKEHSQLAWIFNCVVRMGWLNRMTQFKDKGGANFDDVSAGLFVYPTLMAADVLLYHADLVPVGHDQKQHIELMRDIAQKFNNDFAAQIREKGFAADFFKLPEPVGADVRIMSLRDGSKKMAKSEPSDNSRINLADTPDTIIRKIKKAKSDSEPLPQNEAMLAARPEANNLVNIYAILAGISKQQVLDEFAGSLFAQFKPKLADIIIANLDPVRIKMNQLLADKSHIDAILAKGAEKARPIAAKNLDDIQNIIGFVK